MGQQKHARPSFKKKQDIRHTYVFTILCLCLVSSAPHVSTLIVLHDVCFEKTNQKSSKLANNIIRKNCEKYKARFAMMQVQYVFALLSKAE